MKTFKQFVAVMFIVLFAIALLLVVRGDNDNITYSEYLTENTSYEWEETHHAKCIGAFDEYIEFETIDNEFKLTLYLNNDEIINAEIIANDGYVGELDGVIYELEQALDITFWYNF